MYDRTGEVSSNCKLDKPSTEDHELSLIEKYICIIVQRLSKFIETLVYPDTETEYM